MASFPDQEIAENRKPPSEAEVLDRLRRGRLTLSPLNLQLQRVNEGGASVDGVLEVNWGRERSTFLFEYKNTSSSRVLTNAVAQIKRIAAEPKTRSKVNPMVIVPFLGTESLKFLEQEKVSGIDLCGNAVVLGERFRFWQSGGPNTFSSSAPIKNVYKGTSSLFARCFLIQPRFASLNDLRNFALGKSHFTAVANQEPSRLVKGTASKVVKALVDDEIVARNGDELELINPRRLLDYLRQNYSYYGMHKVDAKTILTQEECWSRLAKVRGTGLKSVATGLGSATHYGVLSTADRPTIFVNDLEKTIDLLDARPTSVFPNLCLVETKSDVPFFDVRQEENKLWASPVQTWLELATGGPREREAAQELERDLIKGAQ